MSSKSTEYVNQMVAGREAARKFLQDFELPAGPLTSADHSTYYGWHDGFNEVIAAAFANSGDMCHHWFTRFLKAQLSEHLGK